MEFLNNKNIYKNTTTCIEYLRSLDLYHSKDDDDKRIFHCYWGNEFGAKACLSIKSFLATQNLDHVKLWLWLDKDDAYDQNINNPYLAPFLSKIEIKRYDVNVESANTPLSLLPPDAFANDLLKRSDLFRLLILYKYGGCYFDLDMLFLRDLSAVIPIFPKPEFCYQWAAKPYANSAFFSMKKTSGIAVYLMEKAIKFGSFHPKILFNIADANLKILMLPSTFFDPAWLHVTDSDTGTSCPFEKFEDFFKLFQDEELSSLKPKIHAFLDYCLTYHWHNQWMTSELKSSIAGYYNNYFDSILERRFGLRLHPSFFKEA
jgi:hypothetical protein